MFSLIISADNCPLYLESSLSRGYIIATKYILDLFHNDFLQYEVDIQNVKTVLASYLNDDSIRSLNKGMVLMFETFSALDAYSVSAQSSYNDYVTNVILYLFVFYLLVVVLLFSFGWSYFFIKFNREFHETKILMSLFNLGIILENPFII